MPLGDKHYPATYPQTNLEEAVRRIDTMLESIHDKTLKAAEVNRRKSGALWSFCREANALADVITSAGLPESAKVLRSMASRAADAAEISPDDVT